ncbi:hypothetical protein D3C72_1678280 [compost metagenome]
MLSGQARQGAVVQLVGVHLQREAGEQASRVPGGGAVEDVAEQGRLAHAGPSGHHNHRTGHQAAEALVDRREAGLDALGLAGGHLQFQAIHAGLRGVMGVDEHRVFRRGAPLSGF